MIKKIKLLSVFLFLAVFLTAGFSYAEDKEKKEAKRPSKEEMLMRIGKKLAVWKDELAEKVEGIVKKEGKNNKPVYMYEKYDGQIIPFSELDEETLYMIYKKINRESSVLQVNRINRQLEMVERVEKLTRLNSGAPGNVIPKTPAAPQSTPNVPKQAPSIPSVPKEPRR